MINSHQVDGSQTIWRRRLFDAIAEGKYV